MVVLSESTVATWRRREATSSRPVPSTPTSPRPRMAMPSVELAPCSPSEATGDLYPPLAEACELKPLQASLTALCSDGEPLAEPEPPCLPLPAVEPANTDCPSWVTTPAVAPPSRAAN